MASRITIQWTKTAKDALADLPPKVRRGLLEKADGLAECEDPRTVCKRLIGPLEGYYRIVYSRYRAIFSVEEERIANGDLLLHLKVVFVAVGIRKELDRNDVYKVARKLIEDVLPTLSDDIDELELRERDIE